MAERIPMPDESVDVVVSRGSFYFWEDRAQGLREVWRVLRPDGRAMIGGGLGIWLQLSKAAVDGRHDSALPGPAALPAGSVDPRGE